MSTRSFDLNDPYSRPDTRPLLGFILKTLGYGVRGNGRALQTAHSTLVHAMDENRPPPTLDTMAIYSKRALEEGYRIVFTVDPIVGVTYECTPYRAPNQPEGMSELPSDAR